MFYTLEIGTIEKTASLSYCTSGKVKGTNQLILILLLHVLALKTKQKHTAVWPFWGETAHNRLYNISLLTEEFTYKLMLNSITLKIEHFMSVLSPSLMY
jgi:hypothetical protein